MAFPYLHSHSLECTPLLISTYIFFFTKSLFALHTTNLQFTRSNNICQNNSHSECHTRPNTAVAKRGHSGRTLASACIVITWIKGAYSHRGRNRTFEQICSKSKQDQVLTEPASPALTFCLFHFDLLACLWPFQPSASHRCAPALEARNMKYVLQFVKAMAQLTVNSIQCNPILQINF